MCVTAVVGDVHVVVVYIARLPLHIVYVVCTYSMCIVHILSTVCTVSTAYGVLYMVYTFVVQVVCIVYGVACGVCMRHMCSKHTVW